jgi:hypothetical protein
MPIRINLLAEQQAEEEARRPDPVKRAAWAAGVVIALMGIWSLYLQGRIWLMSEQSKGLEAKWQSISTNNAEVNKIIRNTAEVQARLQALNQLATNRFLIAPNLSALQYTPVPSVRLTRLRVDSSYTPDVVVLKSGRITNIIEKQVLTLQGVVQGSSSVDPVEQLKTNIIRNDFFQRMLLKTNGLYLRDFAPRPDPEDATKSVGTFTLECYYPTVKH